MTAADAAGGGEGRPRPGPAAEVVLHEEEASVERRWEGVGHLLIRREVDTEVIRGTYPRQVELLAEERVPVAEDDSGEIETLPDGSVSIPLFEEELVITRRTVLRERVIVRKQLVTEQQTVHEQLRRERVSFDGDAPEGSVRI